METRTAPRKTRIKYLHRARLLGPCVFVCVVITWTPTPSNDIMDQGALGGVMLHVLF